MYQQVVVNFNNKYEDQRSTDPRKIIFQESSNKHITITAIDPIKGTVVEVMVRKDDVPNFVLPEKKLKEQKEEDDKQDS